jgi:putative oxidoreductase
MSYFMKLNEYVFNFGNFLKDFLLLMVRLYWGCGFFLAGFNKIGNISMLAEFLESVMIPFPWQQAYLVTGIEIIGGLCLLVGFASRIVSIPLAFIMIVALFTAHLSETLQTFENPQRLLNQLPFQYLAACLLVLCFGPGKFSIDAWFGFSSFDGGDSLPKRGVGSK